MNTWRNVLAQSNEATVCLFCSNVEPYATVPYKYVAQLEWQHQLAAVRCNRCGAACSRVSDDPRADATEDLESS